MSILDKTYFLGLPNHGVRFDPDSSCVLWLPGQDDAYSATIRDLSGGGYNGTITTATWTRLASGLWCLSFDGTNDYVDIGAKPTAGLTQVTVLAWLKPNDISASETIIADHAGPEDRTIILGVGDVAATGTWQTRCIINGENIANQTFLGDTTTLAYGSWYFAGVTWDNTNQKSFVNGVADGSNAYVDTQLEITTTSNLAIGAYTPAAASETMDGYIALIRIYNRALGVTEILDIYNQERHLFGV